LTVPPPPSRRDTDGRRRRILEVAAKRFASRGFDGVTMAEIAEAVGITAPALYRYFQGKQDLLEAATGGFMPQLCTALETVPTDDPQARYLALVAVGAVVLDEPDVAATYARERARLLVRRDGREAERRFARLLVRATNPVGSSAEIEARIVGAIGVFYSLAVGHHRLGRPTLEQFVAQSLDRLLSGVLADLGTETLPVPEGDEWVIVRPSRQRILDASITEFRRRGFAAASIAEIGSSAGVGPTNVYRYYSSKEEVLVDLVDQVAGRTMTSLEDALRTSPSPRVALERMIRELVEITFAHSDLVVVASEELAGLPAFERPRLRRRRQRMSELWRAAIRASSPAVSPEEARTLVTALFALVNIYPQLQLDPLPDTRLVTALMTRFALGDAAS
jgi:AcrR family transcriptional regulator